MSGIDSSRRPIAMSPRTWTVSCGPTTAFQLAQAADRPTAVTDEVAVSEVLVGGGVGRHEPVVVGAGSGVRFGTGLYCLV